MEANDSTLSSLQTHSDYRSEIQMLIAELKRNPEGRGSSYFTRAVINFVWTGITIELEDFEGERYEQLIQWMAKNPKHFKITPDNIPFFKKFIISYLDHAYASDLIFRESLWLEKYTRFLVDLQKFSSLIWLGSFLATHFIEAFHKIYLNLKSERNTKTEIVKRQNLTEVSIEEVKADVECLTGDLECLGNFWTTYMKIILVALQHKQQNSLLSDALANIFKCLEDYDPIFECDNFYFGVYMDCLRSQNYPITINALKSIRRILENDSILFDKKLSFLKYMIRKENACTLYLLAVHKSLRIVERALWLILFVYKCKMKLTSWTPEQNCTVFLNMFKTSNEVRKLSGELMLSMLADYSDARKLTSILDFYIQYKSSPEDMPILIDALWGFNYMTNVENIIILFQSPVRDSNTKDFQIRNAALAHFCVVMVDRLIKCDSYDREKVINFLKAMPFLLKKLQNTPVAVTILCKIFSMVDLAMYEPHYIGDKKYADDLSKQFVHILSQCSDYQCLQSIMKAFIEFSSAGFAEFKIGFSRIAISILNGFEAINYRWATGGDGVGDEGFEELKLASCRLSILLSHEFTLDESEFQAIYDILNITIFTNDHLKHIPQKFRIIEIYYLESFSNLLLTRLIHILDASQIDSEYILETKNKIIMVSSRLQELLTQPEESLFNREKIIQTIIHLLLSLQPTFVLRKESHLRVLGEALNPDTYRCVVGVCTDLLCDDKTSTAANDALKRKIISHLTRLHKDHTGLSSSTIEWKYFAQLLLECKFVHEVNELFLVSARYETPFDRKHRRISTVLAAIFINWADNTQGSKAVITRLVNLFKNNLEDWRELFAMIVLKTIANLLKRVDTIPPERHRIKALNLLKPFLFSDENFRSEIFKAIAQFTGRLRRDESATFKDFRKSIP